MSRGFYETPPFFHIVKIHFPDEEDTSGPAAPTFTGAFDYLGAGGNSPAPGQATSRSNPPDDIIAAIHADGLFPGREVSLSGFTPVLHQYGYHANVSPQYLYLVASQVGPESVGYTVTDLYPTGNLGQVDIGTVQYGTLHVAAAGSEPAQTWEVTAVDPHRVTAPEVANYAFLIFITFTRTDPPP